MLTAKINVANYKKYFEKAYLSLYNVYLIIGHFFIIKLKIEIRIILNISGLY